MAIIELHPSTLHKRRPWSALARSLLNRYAEDRKKRRAIAELRGLDARILEDIAIDRSELTSIVEGDPRGRRRIYRSEDLR